MPRGLINENQLIAGLNKGDESAFVMLFDIYSPVLASFMSKLNLHSEDITDTVQQTFLKVWESREKIDPRSSFKNYIITIAKNDIYNKINRKIVAQKHAEHLTANATAYETIHSNELSDILSGILEQMPEKRKKVFEMSRVYGYSNKEIAQELGISKSTVENHINHSSATIKKLLRGLGFWMATLFFLILS